MTSATAGSVRIGIVGLGRLGRCHAENLTAFRFPGGDAGFEDSAHWASIEKPERFQKELIDRIRAGGVANIQGR